MIFSADCGDWEVCQFWTSWEKVVNVTNHGAAVHNHAMAGSGLMDLFKIPFNGINVLELSGDWGSLTFVSFGKNDKCSRISHLNQFSLWTYDEQSLYSLRLLLKTDFSGSASHILDWFGRVTIFGPCLDLNITWLYSINEAIMTLMIRMIMLIVVLVNWQAMKLPGS